MTRLLPVIALCLTATPLIAQEATDTPSAPPAGEARVGFLTSADDLKVVDQSGQTVGEIEEILIDGNGQPAAFLVELEGFLGIGRGDVTMPIDSLDFDGASYVTTLSEAELERLSPFED